MPINTIIPKSWKISCSNFEVIQNGNNKMFFWDAHQDFLSKLGFLDIDFPYTFSPA
jgi:hypothetical protein